LTGVIDPDKLQCEFASACREEFNVKIFPEVQVEFIDGVAIVVAFIPEAFSRHKPVHIKRLGIEKGTFR
jgi:ATP-dependent DNA helicase RecG